MCMLIIVESKQFFVSVHRNCFLPGWVLPFWHSGRPFWQLGRTLGRHFNTSGPPWRTIWSSNMFKCRIQYIIGRSWNFYFSGLFPGHFFIDLRAEILMLETPRSKFSQAKYCTNQLFTEIVVYVLWCRFLSFLEGLGSSFSGFLCFENNFKLRTVLNQKTNLEPGIWRCGFTRNSGPHKS